MPSPPAVPLLIRCVNALTLNPSAFAWLFAPKLTSLGFSLRTTFASLLALAIAFWMELDQPQWAAMTVWIVAQGTRGESISKGRWRVVGTLAGVASAMALVSMAPQQPWLFFPLLAAWVGLCTALGTLVNNFRSYAFVLTAYTCAIVAISAVDAQDQIFDIAVSRGTYILLGVICEMVVAAIFIPNVAAGTQKAIRSQLREIISRSSGAVRAILLRQSPRESDLHEIFSLALTLNDRMEFSAIEVGRNEPLVRSARAVLGQVTRLTSRGVGMRSRLAATGDVPNGISQKILTDVAAFFERLPEELDHAVAPQSLRQDVWTLQKRCQAGIESTLAPTEAEKKTALNDRIVLQGLALLLGELEHLLGCYAGDMRETTLSARFRLVRPPDWGATFANGIRSALAVLLGAIIWEVTAWSYGALFVTFVAVVCARFASFSNPVIASRNFLFGAVWAVALSIIPVFLVMPVTADYPVLCLAVGVPMIIGGLAARNPAIAALAASFTNFFPYMISPKNHFRTDEIHWFNTSLALLAGLGFGVLVFRYILPFSLPAFISNFRAHVIRSLHRIAEDSRRIGEPAWVGFIVRNMEKLIANGRGLVPPEMDGLLKGAFSAMTMGRNLMQLRHSSTDVRMPSQAQLVLTHMFEALSPSSRSVSAMTAPVERTLDALFQIEKTAMGVGREQVTMALGCLIIVRMELRYRNLLLDPDYIADLKAWS